MFKKILVPLDGSEMAETALAPALKLAELAHGEVILFRSVIPIYLMMPPENAWVGSEYLGQQILEETKEYLQALQDRYQRPNVKIEIITLEGDAASLIIDLASKVEADLIVMSTYGWTGMKRVAFGSVTERVLGHAPVPVYVVRSSDTPTHILLTLDGSPLAEAALEPSLALATALKAKLTLLIVNAPFTPENIALQQWEHREGQQIHELNKSHAERYLKEVAAHCAQSLVEIQFEVIDGSIVDQILEFANSHEIDLIVMSTHGRTGLRRWLYGSVAVKVIRRALCSILIVRPPFRESSPKNKD